MEPISPELVLVDPALARRVRAQPRPMPWTVVAPVTPTAILAAEPSLKHTRIHAGPFALGGLAVALLCVVALQLYRTIDRSARLPTAAIGTVPHTSSTLEAPAAPTATSSAFSPPPHHDQRQQRTEAFPTARTATKPVGNPIPARVAAVPEARDATTNGIATRALAERTVLLLLQKIPSRKLTRGLIDPVTKLVKTNVQITCRRVAHATFRCLVDNAATGSRLPLVYRSNRSGLTALSLPK